MSKHVAMVVKKDDKLLFVKRALTKKSLPGIWSFPSGTIEEGELPTLTAVREVKEELNLDVISTKVFLLFSIFRVIVLFIIFQEKIGSLNESS